MTVSFDMGFANPQSSVPNINQIPPADPETVIFRLADNALKDVEFPEVCELDGLVDPEYGRKGRLPILMLVFAQ